MVSAAENTNDFVVLVHGIAAGRFAMYPLEYGLGTKGYRVNTWCYNSLFDSVASHAAAFNDYLKSLSDERRVHIIAHSMGSIITRAALNAEKIANLGRVIFIAPPNRGTPLAGWARHSMGTLFKPLTDLSNEPSSFVCNLSDQHEYEIGIIAARFDLIVPLDSTYLKSAREHVILNATHNSVLISGKTQRLISHFLVHGTFFDEPDRVRL